MVKRYTGSVWETDKHVTRHPQIFQIRFHKGELVVVPRERVLGQISLATDIYLTKNNLKEMIRAIEHFEEEDKKLNK